LKAQLKAMQSKLDSLNQELKTSRTAGSSQTHTGAGAGAGRNEECWSCGMEDHLSKDCPQKGKGKMDNKEDKQR
jgi:Zinc knuckle